MHVGPRGEVLWFCSSKCYKNALKLKRKARNLKWTKRKMLLK
ncbi:MAG: hypothetical protein F7B61_03365 [Caldisphaeraceae archaeon]|nr:hypothetical protein [Caldisphaeraceae archaeon]